MCSPERESAAARVGSMRPLCDADIVRRFVTAFAAATRGASDDAMRELCLATIALGAMLREQGRTPERAVVSMKEWLTRHDGSGWSPSLDVTDDAVRTESLIYAEVLPWFVASYYGDITDAGPCRVSPDLPPSTPEASWPHAAG
jgi:hypothetical protein